jgi:hypothetical protein
MIERNSSLFSCDGWKSNWTALLRRGGQWRARQVARAAATRAAADAHDNIVLARAHGIVRRLERARLCGEARVRRDGAKQQERRQQREAWGHNGGRA